MFKASKIAKVTPIGQRLVADITVADNHSYIGNGIVNHNSADPNIQNIPKHIKVDDEAVREVVAMIMRSIVVPEGYALVSLDFSQAELRIIAEFADETNMLNAYNNGQDLHALTASKLLGITLEEFYKLPEEKRDYSRFMAKAANFGLIYGQSVTGYQQYAEESYGIKLTLAEAQQHWDAFFDAYPKLLKYHEKCIAMARKFGYTRTLFGRTQHAPNILNEDEYLRAMDERAIINHPVQGTCGEMTIWACGLIRYRAPESCKFINTIHDNIMTLVPLHLVPYYTKLAQHTAENLPTELYFGKKLSKIKLVADVDISTSNWKELKKYNKDKWKDFMNSEIDSYYKYIAA